MCIAELNVSLLSCRHRWYHMVRPCQPSAHLSNCGQKLCLSGWEIKCDFCPYCSGWNLSDAETVAEQAQLREVVRQVFRFGSTLQATNYFLDSVDSPQRLTTILVNAIHEVRSRLARFASVRPPVPGKRVFPTKPSIG